MALKTIVEKPDGTVVVTARLTFKPGRDDALIQLVKRAASGSLAATIREAMRSGASEQVLNEVEIEEVDTSGLGMEI